MAATTNTTTTQADVDLGCTVVRYAVSAITQTIAMLIAWSFSGWAFVIAAVLLSLAASLIGLAIRFALSVLVSSDTFGAIGSKLGGIAGRLFSRSASPAVATEWEVV